MKIGPKYKIARRLGAPIFEKTQTQKYTLSLARKEKSMGKRRRGPKSEYGQQLIEKQKARLTYGLAEKQFRKYVDKSLKSSNPVQKLFTLLETRLDNVLYRAGFTKTRAQARQAASHGHILVNNRRVTVPSIELKKGDTLSIRAGSVDSALFREVTERMQEVSVPAWLEVKTKEREVQVTGEPVYAPAEQVFSLETVMEFYNR